MKSKTEKGTGWVGSGWSLNGLATGWSLDALIVHPWSKVRNDYIGDDDKYDEDDMFALTEIERLQAKFEKLYYPPNRSVFGLGWQRGHSLADTLAWIRRSS